MEPLYSLLSEAGHMLSAISRGAGVVLAAKQDIRLKHVEFVRIEANRALADMAAGRVMKPVLVPGDGTAPTG